MYKKAIDIYIVETRAHSKSVRKARLDSTANAHSQQSHLESLEAQRFGDYLTRAKTNTSPLQPKLLPW